MNVNLYRIQGFDLISYGYFCIEFIDSMLNNKRFADFVYLFLLNNFEEDKIILGHFQ